MSSNDMDGIIDLYSGVLTGLGGLVWHGMTNMYRNFLEIAVEDKKLDGIRLYGADYVYVEELDKNNFLVECEDNPKILIPTKERSIIDYMRFGISVEEDENLMIAIQEYIRLNNTKNLIDVAKFYNVENQIIKAIDIAERWDSEN